MKLSPVATLTKTVDGNPIPAEKFAFVGDPQDTSTWKLPLDTKEHVHSALSMYAHANLPASAKIGVAKKIASAAKDAGFDTASFEQNHCSSDHADAASGWIEVFRAGDYRQQGKSLITRDDLDRVVRNYDPAFHEAPVTVGHPADNLPAFGWIDRLAVSGDTLLAKEKQVDPDFNELRRAGRYKKRSASFYTDANGKVTGLRHVAYLGAQPPAVKGLQDVKFKDDGREFIEVSFGEENSMDKSVTEQIKDYFVSLLNGGEASAKSFSEENARRIATEAVAAAVAPLQAEIADQKAKLAAQAAQFAEREAALAGSEVQQKALGAVTRLKAAGRWIPAFEKMGVPLVFGELAKIGETLDFGEGDAKKKVQPLDLLVEFFEGLPSIIPAGRIFTGQTVSSTKGSTGDPLTDAAKARQREKGISFSEALDQVVAEHPELVRAGAAAAGSI